MGYRIGIDVGGTFTDFLVMDDRGQGEVFKTASTPDDPATGVFNGFEEAASSQGLSVTEFLERTRLIVHGTTVTTNAVLTRSGARVGLLTTEGFRDSLEMRRGIKERLYDMRCSPPPPLVPRHLRIGVAERIDAQGDAATPLRPESVLRAVEAFRAAGVEAVAVSLLFSFLNPAHEREAGRLIAQAWPEVYLSLSSEVLPAIREYERTSTVVLNAYVGPILHRYLGRLEALLREHRFSGALLIMQSNGGVSSPQAARKWASATLLSGPAAAPATGLFYGRPHETRNLITLDMGGTSCDICVVKDGEPRVTTEGEIGGYRIASPIIDIHTIGAGGGSIAWIDEGGMLQVGPRSAGARPGPICYGQGGEEPTVVDVNLLLGYLNPKYFLGGKIPLDESRPKAALRERIASPLGLDALEAAVGIWKVVNANMADGLRAVTVERGDDPREFTLVVAGGAGPIHACAIARELDVPAVVIPRNSSVFCAAGMLISDLRHHFVATHRAKEDKLEMGAVRGLFEQMARRGAELLDSEGVPESDRGFSCSVDARYVGQPHEVNVSVEWEELKRGDLAAVIERFHKRHDDLFGYSEPEEKVEILNLRLVASGLTPKPVAPPRPRATVSPEAALKGTRDVFFASCGGWKPTPIYDGHRLDHGHRVRGGAVIEQRNTTIVVEPGFDLACDEHGNYLLTPHNGGRP
ncbi:MAG: hydantoinase/oxoprolinase family protein [Candidatus Tectomicrobia bacterium]|nr:hydantoinase/oxoprolinase family protein [Candidatus Tectomicrobia bacterium]